MKKVEHTKQSNQPLILNENLNFSMDFSFWAAEVDLLSVLVTGKKSIIEGESLKAYLQGVVEHLVLESTTVEGKREVAIAAAIKSGMSEKQIASYLRGWDQVGEKLEIDASDKLLEKATKKTLIAYQVGDNDVVAAYDEEGAIKVLGDHCGSEFQVTRTEAKEFKHEILCNDCEIHQKAFQEGVESVKNNKPLNKLEVDLTPVEAFDVKIQGVSIGRFIKTETWEGFSKLVDQNNNIIIINDEGSFVDNVFKNLLPKQEITRGVFKITPSLIPEGVTIQPEEKEKS